jgi:hypothetical protein
VDVACPQLDRFLDHQVDQADHRRVAGVVEEIADLLEKEGLNFGMRFEESTDGVRVADWGTPPSRAAAAAPDDEEEE